jgi:hypothetical protein
MVSLDEVDFDTFEVGEADLRLSGLFGRLVPRAVRTGAAGRPLAGSLAGEQRDVDVLADVLDVGGTLQHGVKTEASNLHLQQLQNISHFHANLHTSCITFFHLNLFFALFVMLFTSLSSALFLHFCSLFH